MFHQKRKKINFIQLISIVFLALFLSLFSPQKTEAAWIPGMDPMIQRMLDTIYEQVVGMVMGAAKTAAVKMLNSQVDSLVSGKGTGNAAFITNWKDYLVTQPKNNTATYMNSRLTQMTAGKGSSTGYSSEGFSGSGNYASALTQAAKNSVAQKTAVPQMTYQSDPSKMFAGGNFKNLELYLSGINNPWSFSVAADNAYQEELANQKNIQQTQAVAYQGFKPTTSGTGDQQVVTRPGILTKETVANVENLPNNVIASAKSVPEVISSVVSQMIAKAIQQGFSGMQKSAQSQISTQSKLNSGMNNAMNTSGPAAQFNALGH